MHSIDTTYTAGLAGNENLFGGPPASDGDPIDNPSAVTLLPGPARTCEFPSPLRAGETGTLTLTGGQGDAVATLLGFSTESFFSFDLFGSLLVGLPIVVTFHGFLPASDPTIALPATFAPFPPSLPYLQFYLQNFVFTSVGNAQLGSATAVTVLNQAF